MKFKIKLYEKQSLLLDEFITKNNCKSKAEAVRQCIEIASDVKSRDDLLLDMNSKLNRIIYRENIQKKLLEQFYANMEFPIEQDVKTDESLKRFYQNNSFYLNKIMD